MVLGFGGYGFSMSVEKLPSSDMSIAASVATHLRRRTRKMRHRNGRSDIVARHVILTVSCEKNAFTAYRVSQRRSFEAPARR
jgi:hypothetical protein